LESEGDARMNSSFEKPLTDFPQFWMVSAAIYLFIAVYLAYSGYKRYRGDGILYPNERIFLWIYQIIKGKKKSKEFEKQIIKDTRKNKFFGSSAIIGAIGSFLASILRLIGAFFMTNAR
jgi:hypothetical protein